MQVFLCRISKTSPKCQNCRIFIWILALLFRTFFSLKFIYFGAMCLTEWARWFYSKNLWRFNCIFANTLNRSSRSICDMSKHILGLLFIFISSSITFLSNSIYSISKLFILRRYFWSISYFFRVFDISILFHKNFCLKFP